MKNTTNWTKLYAPRQNDAGKWETRVTDANDKLLAVVEHDTEQEARDWQLRAMMGELGGLLKAAEDDTDDD